jgi:nitrite reductase/ring-hydroxylating ferredoxin subunit
MPLERIRIAAAAELRRRRALKFSFGQGQEGFVIEDRGNFFAYENKCCHVPLPLDYGEGEFFSPDGKRILCRNHGAEYDPATGKCLRGPCAEKSLRAFPVLVEQDTVYVEIPAAS